MFSKYDSELAIAQFKMNDIHNEAKRARMARQARGEERKGWLFGRRANTTPRTLRTGEKAEAGQ